MSGLTARVTLSPTTVKGGRPALSYLTGPISGGFSIASYIESTSTLRAAMRCFTCSLTDRIATLLVHRPTNLHYKTLTFSFGPVHCFVCTFCRRPSPGSYSTVQRQYSCRLPFLWHVRVCIGPGQSAAPAAAVGHNAADHPRPQPFVLGAGSRFAQGAPGALCTTGSSISPFCRDSPSFARDFA